MRKRILVTGGAGFLGSHLCAKLIDAKHDVLCVDNFYTGSKDNVRGVLKCSRFELMRHDITFPLYGDVVEIYSIASPASPIHQHAGPVEPPLPRLHGSINV